MDREYIIDGPKARFEAFSTRSAGRFWTGRDGVESGIVGKSQLSQPADPSQLDKFKEAARQLGAGDDPERFKERLGTLVKHRPVPERAPE
jgi:hypothetical protein